MSWNADRYHIQDNKQRAAYLRMKASEALEDDDLVEFQRRRSLAVLHERVASDLEAKELMAWMSNS